MIQFILLFIIISFVVSGTLVAVGTLIHGIVGGRDHSSYKAASVISAGASIFTILISQSHLRVSSAFFTLLRVSVSTSLS